MVATEGALWGIIKGHGFLPGTVIVSDDAGQFNVGQQWPVLGSCRTSRSQARLPAIVRHRCATA
jgi:hypothetical protein